MYKILRDLRDYIEVVTDTEFYQPTLLRAESLGGFCGGSSVSSL